MGKMFQARACAKAPMWERGLVYFRSYQEISDGGGESDGVDAVRQAGAMHPSRSLFPGHVTKDDFDGTTQLEFCDYRRQTIPEAGRSKSHIILTSLQLTEQARSRQLLSYFLTGGQLYKTGLEETDTKRGDRKEDCLGEL